MQKFRLIGLAIPCLLMATASADVSLSFIDIQAMSFGAVVSSHDNAGRVILSPTGGRICEAGLICLGAGQSQATAYVTGTPDMAYSVALPQSVSIRDPEAGTAMRVDGFTSSLGGGVGVLTGGIDSFSIGATLNVAADQPRGNYSGELDISVSYE